MKILKEGKWNNPWKLQATCAEPNCGAVLEVEEADVQHPGDYISDYYSFDCPVCGHATRIEEKYLPQRIKEKLNKGKKHNTAGYRD